MLPRWHQKHDEPPFLSANDISQTSSWFSPSQWFSYAKDTWNNWMTVAPTAMNTTTALANIESPSSGPAYQEITCQMMPLEERFVLSCPEKDVTRYVYPKISSVSDATDLMIHQGDTNSTSDWPPMGDTYDASTCKVSEFYGQPAVYCEGEKTVIVTVPRQQPSNLNANLMLGIFGLHLAKQILNWFTDKSQVMDKPVVQMVSKEEAKSQLEELTKRLKKLEKLPLDKAEKWALKEHQNTLHELQEKTKITADELEELALDVTYFENEINEAIPSNDMPENEHLVIQEPIANHLNRFGIFSGTLHTESSVIQRQQNLEQDQVHFLVSYR